MGKELGREVFGGSGRVEEANSRNTLSFEHYQTATSLYLCLACLSYFPTYLKRWSKQPRVQDRRYSSSHPTCQRHSPNPRKSKSKSKTHNPFIIPFLHQSPMDSSNVLVTYSLLFSLSFLSLTQSINSSQNPFLFHFLYQFHLVYDFQVASPSSAGMRKNETLICAPIMGDSVHIMKIYMHKAKVSGADLVEIRLDSLKTFNPFEDLNTLIKDHPLPQLFTYRFNISLSLIISMLCLLSAWALYSKWWII